MNSLLERIRHELFSSEKPLEERMFFLGIIVAFGTMVALLVISGVTNQGAPVMITLSVLLVVLILVFVFAYRTGNTTASGVVLSLIVALVMFPAGYLLGGGAYSGAPVWFVIAIAFMATIFRTNYFWVYVVIATISFGASTYIGYRFPEFVVPLQGEHFIYFDTFFATTAVAILVSVLLRYTGRIYNEESKLAQQQKEEIQALSDAQSRFFSSMSHEIRTPLNTIIGLNEMTLRDQQITEEIADNATNIQNASRMLLSLINDILDISKIQSGRMELSESQYETSRMLSDIVNLLWARAKEKNLRFEVNVGENIPSMLYGDEMRLKQVIVNVLTNAIKYTDEGSVTLNVDGEAISPNEFHLRIDVDDTGIGIRKEALPYLFDSFKRVDTERNRNVEGTGLGLAISKQLIDLMGGTITVDSIFTKGSSFQIEVNQKIVDSSPVQYTKLSRATTAGTYENIFEAPEAHVLIVDDNDMNRMVSRKLLRSTRVQTDVAASGRECLEKTANTRYDVIFMDHEMPEMDGIETLQRVRDQEGGLCRNAPVIALTANAGSDMNAFYLNQGFAAYLAKPIHGSLLEATLLQFLPPELIERTNVQAETGESIRYSASKRKRAIAITVDCPCDIPTEMLEAHNIVRMPFYIITSQGRFRDVEEIDSDNLFSYFEDGGRAENVPASVDEYETFFGEVLSGAESVIHLSVSSKVSPAYSVAQAAADSFDNVHVVDSRQYSTGLGLLALEAARLAEDGTAEEELLAALDAYANKIIMTALIASTDSTVIKENIAAPLRLLIHALSWEPVVGLRKGALALVGFHGGYVSEAPEKYIRSAMRKARRQAKKDLLFINYSGCTLEEQEQTRALVEQLGNFDRVISQKASASVAASTWMHTFGIAYVRE